VEVALSAEPMTRWAIDFSTMILMHLACVSIARCIRNDDYRRNL